MVCKTLYKTLCKYNRTIIEDCNKNFICEMNCRKNNLLFEEINRKLYIKVLKRTKIIEPLNSKYDHKIVIKFIVYK